MENADLRPTGLTKDVGYQIGVRRMLPVRIEEAWRLITSPEGLQAWLGDLPKLPSSKGMVYQLPDGSVGEVRVFSPGSHLRITWQPPGWGRASTIQVRTIPNGDRTVIAFHQENLPGPEEREERRTHFKAALEILAREGQEDEWAD